MRDAPNRSRRERTITLDQIYYRTPMWQVKLSAVPGRVKFKIPLGVQIATHLAKAKYDKEQSGQ